MSDASADPEADAPQLGIADAERLLVMGRRGAANAAAERILSEGRVSAQEAGRLYELTERLGDAERAEEVRRALVAGMDTALEANFDHPVVCHVCGYTLYLLREKERGIAALTRSMSLAPKNFDAARTLLGALLLDGRDEETMAIWLPYLSELGRDGGVPKEDLRGLWINLIAGLCHFGYEAQAAEAVRQAGRLLPEGQADGLESYLADAGAEPASPDQMTEMFDRFAEIYDRNLEELGNNGPLFVARALEEIGVPRDGALAILDAGCGTGLCAPFLRPRARLLHGCDLSPGMLAKAEARGGFDALTRTDLADPASYPEGAWDVVVAADVLTYFGELPGVLRNLAADLVPGGWLVFTVEDGGAEVLEWQRYSSGRCRHARGYVEASLSEAGFRAPEVTFTEILRREFGAPILGTCYAARKRH
ncbi:methyltransferase [Roseicyclus sp. F158]|uniref:Methyltransferase n=1 Tax=Tropicimonas omnivorans TaxID=3075590 RepID=A0ABU3DIN1_9RHOB|nr:methyltransferase [Roseicyclus sp. F158]MDT0683585.1 methyltransferase [Roseicyclus sp. F158]